MSQSPYKPLGTKRSIRLLKIGGTSTASEVISCTLSEFELKGCPPFQALSYTWGPAYRERGQKYDEDAPLLFPFRISCNECTIAVTENLYDALKQFKGMYDVGFLWIDAICINQNDLDERADQVLLMGEIYSLAVEVIVWLGKPNIYFEDFLWVVTVLFPRLEELAEECGWGEIVETNPIDLQFIQRLGFEIPDERLLGYGLFHNTNRWFIRAWIVQEVANAQRVRFLCGSTEIAWIHLTLASSFSQRSRWVSAVRSRNKKELNGDISSLEHMGNQLRMIRETCVAAKDSKCPPDLAKEAEEFYGIKTSRGQAFCWLLSNMILLSYTHCRDLRDKVYAALGIAGHIFPSDVRDVIVPDYSVPTVYVYTNVSRLIIKHSVSIHILSFVEGHSLNRLDGLPSWVPDYSHNSGLTTALAQFRGYPRFDASLSRYSEAFDCSIEQNVLSLHGAIFDNVVETCTLLVEERVRTRSFHIYLEFCLKLSELSECRSRVETLWRTLIGDTSLEEEHPAPSTLAESFKVFVMIEASIHLNFMASIGNDVSATRASIESIFTGMKCPSELPSMHDIDLTRKVLEPPNTNWKSDSPEYATKLSKALEIDRSSSLFLSSDMISTGRRFFRTEKGLLGLGPVSCLEGDQIWLIKNAHTPFVLRPTGSGSYTLVGECYLQGFMHGEMLEDRWGLKEKIGPVTLV